MNTNPGATRSVTHARGSMEPRRLVTRTRLPSSMPKRAASSGLISRRPSGTRASNPGARRDRVPVIVHQLPTCSQHELILLIHRLCWLDVLNSGQFPFAAGKFANVQDGRTGMIDGGARPLQA